MKNLVLFFVLIFLVNLNSNAFGESTKPPKVNDTINIPATLKNDLVQEIRIGNFNAKLEKTTLGEIKETLKSGFIEHSGDAGNSQYWLCYSLPGQTIWLISNGEMGGRNHDLTQIQAISTDPSSRSLVLCPIIPKKFLPITLFFGWLGQDKKSLFKAIGPPAGTEGNKILYYYEEEKIGSNQGQPVQYYVTEYLEFELANDKIVKLYISHITSY